MSSLSYNELVFIPAVVIEEGSPTDPTVLTVIHKGGTFDVELPVELEECLLKTPEEVRLYSLRAMEVAIEELSAQLEFAQQGYRDLCGKVKDDS